MHGKSAVCLRSECVCLLDLVKSCLWVYFLLHTREHPSRVSLVPCGQRSSVVSRRPRPIPQCLVDAVSMLGVSDGRWGSFSTFVVKTRYPKFSVNMCICHGMCMCIYYINLLYI